MRRIIDGAIKLAEDIKNGLDITNFKREDFYKSVIAKSLQNIFDKGIMCISISSAKSKRSKTEYACIRSF